MDPGTTPAPAEWQSADSQEWRRKTAHPRQGSSVGAPWWSFGGPRIHTTQPVNHRPQTAEDTPCRGGFPGRVGVRALGPEWLQAGAGVLWDQKTKCLLFFPPTLALSWSTSIHDPSLLSTYLVILTLSRAS